MTDDPSIIREPQPKDAKSIRQLARMAHPDSSAKDVSDIGKIAEICQSDITSLPMHQPLTGLKMDVPVLISMRVMGPPDEWARAMVYSAPPLVWIGKQPRNGRTADEVQLLAQHADPRLAPWYESQGYTVTEVGNQPRIRFWADRDTVSPYHHIGFGQRVAFKSLDPTTVTVVKRGTNVEVVGLLDNAPEENL